MQFFCLVYFEATLLIACVFSCVQLFHHLSPSNFPGKNIFLGCHCLLFQGILQPIQELNPSPALAGGFFTTNPTWEDH